MANIYLPDDVKHWEFSQTLTELGGDPSTDFRLSIAWDGQHYFEVTDELYDKWRKSLPENEADAEKAADTAVPAAPTDDQPADTASLDEDGEKKAESGDAVSAAVSTEDATQVDGATGPAEAGDAQSSTSTEKAASPAADESAATEPPAKSDKDSVAAAEKDSDSDSGKDLEAESAHSSGTKRKPSARNTSRRG